MKFKLALALTLACVSAPSFAGITTVKVPVEMDVSPELLNDLPPERRRAIEGLRDDVRAHLWRWDDVTIEFPQSAFADKAVVMRPSDLFRAPDDREIKELTTTAAGERIPLSRDHQQTIRDEGLIIVPSVRYPGHNHVWRLHRFWQKGRDNVNVTFDYAKGLAYNQVWVQIPERLKPGGDRPNALRGAENFVDGLKDSFATVIGLVEEVPRFSDDQVMEILRQEALAHVGENGPSLDLRLYDAKLMNEVRPVLTDLQDRFDRAWPQLQEKLLVPQLGVFRERGLKDEALAIAAREWLGEQRANLFYDGLSKNTSLEKLSPGIARLIIDRDRAVRLTTAAVAAYHEDVARESLRVRTAYAAEHRVKKFAPTVVERAVRPAIEQYSESRWLDATARLTADLDAAGLKQEREIALLNLQYQREIAPLTRERYAQDLVPLRCLPIKTQIWKSEDWGKRERDVRGKKMYEAVTTHDSVVASDIPAWRLAAIGVRTREAFVNQNYHLWHALKVAAKTTFTRDEFFSKEMMNAETGAIQPDPGSNTGTWVTRQRAVNQAWAEANARFENEAEGDVIPKSVLRPAVKVRNAALATAATAGLAVVQTGGFVCTTIFTCVGMAASPLTSPAYGLARWAGDALYYDSADYARADVAAPRAAPLVWQGLTSVGGLGESVFSVALTPLHLGAGAGLYAGGAIQWGARSLWDAAWFSIIKKFNLPTRDKGVVTERIQGPGLEKNVTFVIEPALALAALRAQYEADELNDLLGNFRNTLREPMINATEQLAPYKATGWQPTDQLIGTIARSSTRLEHRVADQIRNSISNLPVINSRRVAVRLAEKDLEPTLIAAEKVSREFWESRDEKPEWTGRSLAEGDYRGLAEQAFDSIFGKGFLAGVRPEDSSLVFKQQTPDFARAFADLVDDRPIRPADVTLESPDRVLAAELTPDVDPRIHGRPLAWSMNETCESLLLKR